MLHGVMVPCSVLSAPEFKGGDWHLIDDLISDRSAAVRVASLVFDNWDVDDGIGQGAVLSGFVLINGLASAIKRACRGASCHASDSRVPYVKVLLYADDQALVSAWRSFNTQSQQLASSKVCR